MRLVHIIGPHVTLTCFWNKGAFPNCQKETVEGLQNYWSREKNLMFLCRTEKLKLVYEVRGRVTSYVNENTLVWGKH